MIVKDSELKKLISRTSDSLLTNYIEPKDWDNKDSLVQPCSLDLHIGDIFRPGIKTGKAGSAGNPKSELVLRTGETSIVVTKESIHLKANYAGFGFPPSHISSGGLLMTNPGHIDPGYSGQLQFTVINMGKDDYVLRKDDLIVTLLIFNLGSNVDSDYSARHSGAVVKTITQGEIDRLSSDFVDVKKRATNIARKTLGYATVGASVLAVILGWAFNAVDKRLEGINDMKVQLLQLQEKNNNLEKELDATKQQFEKLIDIDHRLTSIESQKASGGSK